jgi:hypothetical protein
MAYNALIPQPTDTLNNSQGDLLANFMAIQTLIDVNHYDFASSLQGKHKFVSLPIQSVDPATTTTELALFTKNDGLGIPQLWIRYPNNDMSVDITGLLPSLSAGGGTTTLPSGVEIKFGLATTSAGLQTITFSSPYPTALLSVQATLATTAGAAGAATSLRLYNISVNGFSVNTGVNAQYSWFAIGY